MNFDTLHQEWTARFGNIIADLMLAHARAIQSIRGDGPRLPATDKAITAHLKQHSPGPGPDGKRWAVCGIALRGGQRWTVGVFSSKDDAEEFWRFWGTFVYTEVRLEEIEKGTNPWDEPPLRPPAPRRPMPPSPARRPFRGVPR